jgi:hypothetical protein
MTNKNIAFVCALSAFLVFNIGAASAQDINANWFTHFEYDSSDAAEAADREIEWGESTLFLTGNLGSKWSFLSELTFQPSKYRQKEFAAHRYRIRYEFDRDNAFILGKMHTPVNYWNDNFHHGRIFFPTINRPASFGRFIPVHEVGVRFTGQSPIGEGVGYDIVLGSGQSAGDDAFADGVQSYTASFSWAPTPQSKSMVSYYRDTILDHEDNPFHGAHHHGGGHGQMMNGHGTDMGAMDSGTDEDIPYELLSWSLHHEGDLWRTLTEVSANRTDQGDWNWAAFQYLGYHVNESFSVYGLFDYVNVSRKEIHFSSGIEQRYGLGIEWFAVNNTSLKVELRREHDHAVEGYVDTTVLEAQLAFGF